MVHLNDGAVLVSASSGNHELSFDMFAQHAITGLPSTSNIGPQVYVNLKDKTCLDHSNIHQNVEFLVETKDNGASISQESQQTKKKKILFLNGGFPITFVGRLHAVPSSKIQPTLALMVAATVQAAKSSSTGLLPLDPQLDKWIYGQSLHL